MRPRFLLAIPVALLVCLTAGAAEPEAADIGDRLELFVDRHRIEKLEGVQLVLHSPRAEKVLIFNKPWEGAFGAYVTIFRDGDRFRMYYRGLPDDRPGSEEVTCYAESKDGIHWTKPDLGLFEYQGSKRTNIVLKGPGSKGTHNFTPMKDTRPGVAAEERYKALGGHPLHAYISPDGLSWKLLSDKPVMTKGAFDSQNLAFWDQNRKKYVSYYRIFTKGVRAIARAESDDFRTWSDPQSIDLGATPVEHFYTNATTPYFRAPHYYFSFPKRFVPDRKHLSEHKERGISDGVFLSSRDGLHFDRTFPEAFLRPGRDPLNWGDRSNMIAWGLVQTAPDEMSIYFSQNYGLPTHHLCRGVLRLDGIASARASAAGGELLTKPLRFKGKKLILNYATSAAGSVKVEIQDAAGKAIPGFTLTDAKESYGDDVAEAYPWKRGQDVSSLAGQVIRLRFVLKDANLYSYRFSE